MLTKEEKFIDVLTRGSIWQQRDIRDYLVEHITTHGPTWGNHLMRRDHDDQLYYIYDNDCYLFIEDDKITVRCDRENVWSEGMTHKFTINKAKDIDNAYATFRSMTMEDENETEE